MRTLTMSAGRVIGAAMALGAQGGPAPSLLPPGETGTPLHVEGHPVNGVGIDEARLALGPPPDPARPVREVDRAIGIHDDGRGCVRGQRSGQECQ